MFTDTHCHIFSENYSQDKVLELIEHAKNQGVTKIINNGTDSRTNREVLLLSQKYENIYPAIGIHPEVTEYIEDDYIFIENNISSIVAIGEIGLDYHYDNIDKELQRKIFKRQLDIAQKQNKPVIIHSRGATKDTIDILKEFPGLKGIIHCFTGSLETADEYIKMGFKLGMNGVITFKNSKFRDILKNIPLESIVLETDSPYLSPEPVRGTRNEPANIVHIAKFIAEVKGITVDELSKITEKNVEDIFDI